MCQYRGGKILDNAALGPSRFVLRFCIIVAMCFVEPRTRTWFVKIAWVALKLKPGSIKLNWQSQFKSIRNQQADFNLIVNNNLCVEVLE
jgi:hypothetical protein